MSPNHARPLDVVARAITRRRALASMAGAAIGTVAAGNLIAAQSPVASPTADGLQVRRDAATLTPEERTAYVDAILALKAKPSPWEEGLSVYDTFVTWHRDAFVCGVDAAHMGPAFFPWHRVFLHLFQEQISAIDPSVVLPYWNWTVDTAPDSYLWQDDFMGGNGVKAEGEAVLTGPFQKGKWEITVFDYGDTNQFPYIIRDFGAGSLAPDLPTQEQVDEALAIATYDAAPWDSTTPASVSFRNFFEGWRDCAEQMCDPNAGVVNTCTGGHELHNRVHLWIAGEVAFAHELMMDHDGMTPAATPEPEIILGTMAANSSPNDPVFFLHHVNIDRIWSQWLARYGQVYLPESGGPYGHNLNDLMWPYEGIGLQVSPGMMLDSRDWGYVYDTELT